MMKEGEYYIGDLCYVMHDEWDEVCDLLFEGRPDQGCNEGEFTLKDGRQFAIYNTQHGDGVYNTSFGGRCCVDSGSIGCILKSDIRDNQYTEEHLKDLAVFHTFKTDFDTGIENDSYEDEDGYKVEEKILDFGGFRVYT